jgi:hypothetical protein
MNRNCVAFVGLDVLSGGYEEFCILEYNSEYLVWKSTRVSKDYIASVFKVEGWSRQVAR